MDTKDLELTGAHKQLLNDVARERVILNDVTRELALAHSQQRLLEADRDKTEASLLDQLQGSCKDLAKAQGELSRAKEQIQALTTTIESVQDECARQHKEHATEMERVEAKLSAAEQANLVLQDEMETLQNAHWKSERTTGDLQAKLQTVWHLAVRGASHATENEGTEINSAPLESTPSRKRLIEVKSATPRSDQQSDHEDRSLCAQDDPACKPREQTELHCEHKEDCEGDQDTVGTAHPRPFERKSTAAVYTSTPRAVVEARGRLTDSAEVPASLSGIVDGLQWHIKDLMRSIENRDSQVKAHFVSVLRPCVFDISDTNSWSPPLQHERMVFHMREQKAKIEMLMQQHAEATRQSFESNHLLEKIAIERIIDEKEEDIAGLSHEIDKLKELVEAERASHHAIALQNQDLTCKAHVLQTDKDSLQERVKEQIDRTVALERRVFEQQEALRVAEDSLRDHEHISVLAKERVQECERLQDMLDSLQTELEQAKRDCGQAERQCEVHEQHALRMEKQGEELLGEIERLKLETESVRAALQREKLDSQRLQYEGKMRVAQLDGDVQSLNEKWQRESEMDSKERDVLKTENRELQRKIRTLEGHCEGLQKEKEDMQVECKKMQKVSQDKARLQHDYDSLNVEYDELRAELQVEFRSRHTDAPMSLSVWIGQLTRMNDAAAAKDNVLTYMYVRNIHTWQRTSKSVADKNKTLQEVRMQAEADAEALKSELTTALKATQERTKMQQELRDCHDNIQDLQAEVHRLNKSIADKNRSKLPFINSSLIPIELTC